MRAQAKRILAANAEDVAEATTLVDRLRLDPERLEAMAASMEQIAALPDPVGTEAARWQRPNGLDIARVRTPIGVIGMIFESRPNVTADAAALCLRSGNALILRGGSDALRSCLAIHAAIAAALEQAGLPADGVQMVPTADRDAVGMMLAGLDGAIDLIIPRGGTAARRPGRAGGAGAGARPSRRPLPLLCPRLGRPGHGGRDPGQRQDAPGLGLRRDRDPADRPGRGAVAAAPARRSARRAGCELRGDVESRALAGEMGPASEADWTTEYLAPILAVRTVGGPG